MSVNVIQTSFSGGELARSLFARVDLARYKTGAAKARNMFVDYRSGLSTRTGTEFIIQCLISNKYVRLVEFQYSTISTYILEFGDQYIRFITEGGAVLETDFNISAADNGFPGQIIVPGHNFINGDWIFVENIVGATGYNGRFYTVTVAGNVLTLFTVNGDPVDAATFGTYLSGGTAARVYKIPSPYIAADIPLLKFTQSASVLTITHPSYQSRNLTRVAATNWTLTVNTFATSAAVPTGLALLNSAGGAAHYSYMVTSVDADGQESGPSAAGIIGPVVNISTTAGTIRLSWNAAAGADRYRVYKAQLSIFGAVPAGVSHGFVQEVDGTAFDDSNFVPDFSITPPIANDPFTGTNYPAVTGYFEQRQVYAAPTENPLTFYMSQPGAFNNFDYSLPLQEDDSIEGTLVSGQVNNIKHMVAMPGGLLMLTAKGAWQVNGGSSDVGITPINAKGTPQAFNGCNDLRPLLSNYNILYVQEKGSTVRDLAYSFNTNIYTGADISVLSNHLFFGYTLTDWCYAEEPFKIVWAVRNDGKLLSLTYVKEQEIYGWCPHDTKGTFESVGAITEGEVDAVYAIVSRYIQGRWVKMIERFHEREFPYGAEDAWAVDCGARSTLPTPAAGLTASAATGTVTFEADSPVFASGDVGKVLRMGGGVATISTFISATQLIGVTRRDIREVLPNDPDLTPLPALSGEWSLTEPQTVFRGLDHVEGQMVSILADGSVITPQVVVNGSITFQNAVTKVTAGLKFVAQGQTLPLDTGEPTIQGKRKKVAALTLRCVDTRGLYAGRTFDTITPNKELNRATPLNSAPELITGDARMVMDPLWDVEGQICWEIRDPLPATVLGVIPEIIVGDTFDTKGSR